MTQGEALCGVPLVLFALVIFYVSLVVFETRRRVSGPFFSRGGRRTGSAWPKESYRRSRLRRARRSADRAKRSARVLAWWIRLRRGWSSGLHRSRTLGRSSVQASAVPETKLL